MAELLPCPFCGKKPNIIENKLNLKSILYGVICVGDEHHSASVGYFESEDQAIECWNTRTPKERGGEK